MEIEYKKWWVYKTLNFIIPHFFTEYFAINIDDEGYWSIYSVCYNLIEDDYGKFDFYGLVKGFTWLGFGFYVDLHEIYDLDGKLLEEV